MPHAETHAATPSHQPALPLRIGTRGSPLALIQTRAVQALLRERCPPLAAPDALREEIIRTTGDAVQDRKLAEIGGKGLFAKEIHEALLDKRIDLAVHSLKDLETELPQGVILACTLPREDARDALILAPECGTPDPDDPLAALPRGALVGTSSVRRQAQLLHCRPDLRIALLRGNVQTRLDRVRRGEFAASLLALAGLRRLGLAEAASVVLGPETMLPAACQGIVGVTIRADDHALRAALALIEDRHARIAATAERAVLAELDGSCRTPVGAHATIGPDGALHVEALLARADGSFLLRRSLDGQAEDAEALGRALGRTLRDGSPADILA
jgi:hydroxymethylbilane synthase